LARGKGIAFDPEDNITGNVEMLEVEPR